MVGREEALTQCGQDQLCGTHLPVCHTRVLSVTSVSEGGKAMGPQLPERKKNPKVQV